jgi:hypothetical protein
MKTTKRSALTKRIDKLVASKQLRKGTIVLEWIKLIAEGQTVVRPVYSQGSTWKYSSLINKRRELIEALELLKLEYLDKNDAPKGGQTGRKIQITTKIIQI